MLNYKMNRNLIFKTFSFILLAAGALFTSCTEECDDEAINLPPVVQDQSFTILETDSAGTSVGVVQASDENGDELTYSFMLQTPTEEFAIDATTGEITVAPGAFFNYDEADTYRLIVKVFDGELEATATITINIEDVITGKILVLQPGPEEAEDAIVYTYNPDGIYATHSQVTALAWTKNGVPMTQRSYIQFDLDQLPQGATIEKVYLSLYHFEDNNNAGHAQYDGSNAATIYRVTEPWSEDQITWNTRAAYTSTDSVALAASTSITQDYVNMDITSLVVNDNNERYDNYGYMLKLNTESYYRSLTFASSNVTDPALRPKLVIYYQD